MSYESMCSLITSQGVFVCVNLGCVDVIVVVVVVVSHVENAIILVDSKCLFIRHIPFPTKITVDHQIELSGVIP